ncbi:M48 family metalloprotease [Actinokineospora sp. PR83]|uniref:M48 family metalloprotease n=1 Tax=Actinokineospora sp. PR83 TaxID=2884908 RepID=UPI001F38DBF7|nr:M48 family metalloprotease [Actinokineospora sp. PR83]MCG8920549.1 M48 family metalloprotease [Actinokineospora sp. PR83]
MDEQPHRPKTRILPVEQRRGPDLAAVLSLGLIAPAFLSSLVVMILLGSIAWPSQSWVIPVVWVLSGVVVFVPAIEAVLAKGLFDMHEPSARDLSRLEPVWTSVCRAAGVNRERYRLWIEGSKGLNAFAAGGRTVAVTRAALDLPPHLLEAVLAHELGHHLHGHARVSLLGWWYQLPARGAIILVALVAKGVLAVGRFFGRFGGAAVVLASVLLVLVLLAGVVYLNPWLLLMPLLAPVVAWSSRLGEYRADRAAAALGYAPALRDVLKGWLAAAGGDRRTWRARVLASHPAHVDRIRRLQNA